jgi:hypothetical protein
MMSDLIRFRLRCAGDPNPSPELVFETLGLLVKTDAKLESARYTEFLHGQAGTRSDFWADAEGILRRCLIGDQLPPQDKRNSIAQKLIKFFFQYGTAARSHALHNERGFFDLSYKGLGCVQTANEANAELEVLRCYLREDFTPRGEVLVVRASGFRRFLQRDDGDGMNPSGQLTLKLLNEGATVIYVYPKKQSESPATQTAVSFQNFVNKSPLSTAEGRSRLHLLPISPRDVSPDGCHLNAGSFLSPTLRFGYLRCLAIECTDDDNTTLSRSLIVTQKSRHCPSAYQPDRRELEAFEHWLELFVLSEIPRFQKRVSPGDLHSSRKAAIPVEGKNANNT